MSRPFPPRSSSPSGPFVRVNGKIRAREVRVIGLDGKQLGVLQLGDALNLARANGVDLVDFNNLPGACVNLWRGNSFETDNEDGAAAGPGAGCIR